MTTATSAAAAEANNNNDVDEDDDDNVDDDYGDSLAWYAMKNQLREAKKSTLSSTICVSHVVVLVTYAYT